MASYVAEILALREQLAFLQERVLQAECDAVGVEKKIREEVAGEMKEYLEAAEAEVREGCVGWEGVVRYIRLNPLGFFFFENETTP